MVPTPLECIVTKQGEVADGDRVVISGMSGLYPMAPSVKDLADVLYNKVNPITEQEYEFMHAEMAKYSGKVENFDKFDAQFFMVNYRLACCIDPMSRKIFEQACQAIYDAGLSPDHLNGKKVAVYIATGISENESIGFYDKILEKSLGVLGCSKTMYANRISYWLNAKGPSVAMDGSCCGGLLALEQAYMDINAGRCEAAIVGASHAAFLGHYSIHCGRNMQLSPDGKTRAFDQNANGFGLSDAVTVFFLQKSKDALRNYGEVVHVKTDYTQTVVGDQPQKNIFCRDPKISVRFLRNFYEKSGVSPRDVEYVEAFGIGMPEADKIELDTIDEVFCKDRADPLLVGSVISNVGHTAETTGLVAISKVLLGYEKGVLAGNLHCSKPRQDVNAIQDGRLEVLTDHAAFGRSYAAVNVHAVTGIDSHVLLRGHFKPPRAALHDSTIPHLVTLSNRTENGVKKIIEDLKSRPINPEELALLRNIHTRNISGHLGRGYVILDTKDEQTVSLGEVAEYKDNAKRPLWFVYSGMGSQWAGMGAQLMRIPIFASAIQRCHQLLKPEGVDLIHIITSTDKTIYDNIQNSFLGIAAIQIGLTDLLTHLGLVPDNIIGHSLGELGCAYADGCVTMEEMIMAAYSRGKVSLDTELLRGSMAAVGLGYQQVRHLCPPDIDVACHNGPESCTISGPIESMAKFVAKLTDQGVFAKEVPCSNIAYHSRYIAPAGPALKMYLRKIMKTPRLRSEKWLSTSVPQDKWNEPEARYSSAEYHTNNLLNPVLFEEICRLIPSNAALVEVAPHGLMQAILKRSLPASCTSLAITKRGHEDNALFLLNAVGKLYMEGYTPNVQALYPKVEFPVSTGTPMLSHHVEWNHTENWDMPNCSSLNCMQKRRAAACDFPICIHDEEYKFLQGNVVRGKVLYPFAASLVSAWDTLLMSLAKDKKSQSVEFSEVHLHAQPVLHDQTLLKLTVALNRGNGWFEISNEISKIVTGYIKIRGKHCEKITNNNDIVEKYENHCDEIYDFLKERDYSYSGDFRSIHSANASLTEAYLHWRNNWVTHIDSMLQLNALKRVHDGVSEPIYIRSLLIDVEEHKIKVMDVGKTMVVKAQVCDVNDYTRCGGIVMHNVRFRDVPHRKDFEFKLLAAATDGTTKKIGGNNNGAFREDASKSCKTLQSANIGNLQSLQWVDTSRPTGPGIRVEVYYAGLNNQDIRVATGMTQGINSYGMDFSGTTDSGERVMGVVCGGACSSEVRAQPELLWPVPAHWTLEDAATVPLAYTFALYCLCIKTESLANKSILVHGGAGALGQAAIAIALAHGCQVFATVSDSRKIHFLRKLYPALKEEHIGNSRDSSFGDMVLSATKGRGCDIIISSVNEDLKNISLKCAAFNGITFDTVQIQNQDKFNYGMYHMTRQRSYVALDFSSIFHPENIAERKELQLLVSAGIAGGYVRPLSRVTYAPHDAPRAFRLLAASAHRGRVLLQLRDTPATSAIRMSCSPDRCNVLITDGSNLSVHLANRLISRGARTLHIHSLATSISDIKKRFWDTIGVQVQISSGQLTDESAVSELLNKANDLGQIEGIFLVATKTDGRDEQLANLLENINVITKLICPNTSYVAMLTSANISRTILNSPTTILKLCALKTEVTETENVPWCRGVIDALESAIHSGCGVFVPQQQQQPQPTLLKQIEHLSGFNISEVGSDDVTLHELGLLEGEAKTIRTHLLNVHNTSLTENEVLHLNKHKIREMENHLIEREIEAAHGLAKFFPNVEQNEILATADHVLLPSRARPVMTMLDGLTGTDLFVIPGLDGNHAKFRELCQRIKLPTVVLQPGFDKHNETIQDTAKRFAKILLEQIEVKSKFYLVGYETGIFIALELAAILEKQGMDGTIFCIGSAPRDVKTDIRKQLKEFATETELQDAIVRHMFKVMTNADTTTLEEALRDKKTWSEKVDACVRSIRGIKYSKQYAKALIESAYGKIMQALSYNYTTKPLRSRVVVLSSPDATPSVTSSNLLQNSMEVHQLVAPWSSAYKDKRCASIINRYLSPEILEDFEKKNWCEIYFDDQLTRFADDN